MAVILDPELAFTNSLLMKSPVGREIFVPFGAVRSKVAADMVMESPKCVGKGKKNKTQRVEQISAVRLGSSRRREAARPLIHANCQCISDRLGNKWDHLVSAIKVSRQVGKRICEILQIVSG